MTTPRARCRLDGCDNTSFVQLLCKQHAPSHWLLSEHPSYPRVSYCKGCGIEGVAHCRPCAANKASTKVGEPLPAGRWVVHRGIQRFVPEKAAS